MELTAAFLGWTARLGVPGKVRHPGCSRLVVSWQADRSPSTRVTGLVVPGLDDAEIGHYHARTEL